MIIVLESGDIEVYPVHSTKQVRILTTVTGRSAPHVLYMSAAEARTIATAVLEAAKQVE